VLVSLTGAHGTAADVGDGGVVYSVPAVQWACLGGSRVNGVCTGERREQMEDERDVRRACSGASRACRGALWRVLDVTGRARSGRCKASTG
jgi:hypothetical protein